MQNLFETLIGKKATIFKYNDFGFPSSFQCEIESVYVKDYAQYNNMLHITFRPKRKRKSFVFRIYPYQTFAVWEGHIEVNTEMFVEKTTTDTVTCSKSLLCFSNGYLHRALNSTTQQPLIVQEK